MPPAFTNVGRGAANGPWDNHRIAVRIELPQGHAERILNSIKPDACGRHERRSSAIMNINKNVLSLEINAEDINALKGSFNSYMKLIMLCSELTH